MQIQLFLSYNCTSFSFTIEHNVNQWWSNPSATKDREICLIWCNSKCKNNLLFHPLDVLSSLSLIFGFYSMVKIFPFHLSQCSVWFLQRSSVAGFLIAKQFYCRFIYLNLTTPPNSGCYPPHADVFALQLALTCNF